MLVPLPADCAELIVGSFPRINLISATVFRTPHQHLTHRYQLLESNSSKTLTVLDIVNNC